MTRFTGFSVANSILRIKKFNAILRPLRPRHTTLEQRQILSPGRHTFSSRSPFGHLCASYL